MEQLFSILGDLEQTCTDEDALRRFTQPDVHDALAALVTLPEHDRTRMHEDLGRIRTIMEGNLVLYGQRMETLRKKIGNVSASSHGTNQYRRVVAVLPMQQAQL